MHLLHPIDALLGSQARLAILRVLCHTPRPLTGREIGRRAHVASGHVSRVLRDLSAAGVLDEQHHGSGRLYALRQDGQPIVDCIRSAFREEDDRRQRVVCRLAEAGEGVLAVILFGSEARGEARALSDTDLLFVADDTHKAALEVRLLDAIPSLAEDEGLALSWLVVGLGDVARWDREAYPLWRNILTEGLSLWGESVEEVSRRCRAGVRA